MAKEDALMERVLGGRPEKQTGTAREMDLEVQVRSGSEMWNCRLTMKPSKRAMKEA